ncbi:hypothetical protein FA95DRAFT_1326325 [Auriscalpium vulgare]|uniref:Uncharacterized protein n=1 Tax=Auriscalpium vulgare TaxID=40419 RepID=A0ACB8S8L7_9AGAM|nr:hypothetical protein FA95DRAFT_1326325 [Auriscalpium vulgare]
MPLSFCFCIHRACFRDQASASRPCRHKPSLPAHTRVPGLLSRRRNLPTLKGICCNARALSPLANGSLSRRELVFPSARTRAADAGDAARQLRAPCGAGPTLLSYCLAYRTRTKQGMSVDQRRPVRARPSSGERGDSPAHCSVHKAAAVFRAALLRLVHPSQSVSRHAPL